jgi:hypothetical protein
MRSGHESKPGRRSLVDEMNDEGAPASPVPGKRTRAEQLAYADAPTMLVPRRVADKAGASPGEANTSGPGGAAHVSPDGEDKGMHRSEGADTSGGEAHADGGEAHADGGEAHADGGEAHGNGGEAHGNGGEAHADGGEAHGNGGEAHAGGDEAPVKGDEEGSREPVRAPSARFVDLGQIATVPYGQPSAANQDSFPHAFTDGGQTKTAKWGGGGGAGAHGNQGAGTVQKEKPPQFFRGTPKGDAYIREGSGDVDVVRSWTGVAGGDQGNGHFVTAAAAARINLHETLHVANSKNHYDVEIQPLLTRVGNYTMNAAVAKALKDPPTPRTVPALQKIIDWPATIKRFKTKDGADNKPGGSVDTNDLNSGTYPVDAGPGTVLGKKFKHRVRMQSEPNPPP